VEKGFRETSMREVAEATGMGKSSLYDYFHTKDDILLWTVEDQLLDITAAAQEIADRPGSTVDRLWQVLQLQLEFVIARKSYYLKLMFEVQRLDIESQRRIQVKRHIYQDLIRRLIDQGVEEGAFRPVDSLLVARTVITLLTPTVLTSRPTGTPEEMLSAVFGIILEGIRARVPS
jgi:AcrR family transcriptional regulator